MLIHFPGQVVETDVYGGDVLLSIEYVVFLSPFSACCAELWHHSLKLPSRLLLRRS